MERTFIMVKPDGVARGLGTKNLTLVGEIIARFEKRGFKLVALQMMQKDVAHFKKHYEDLKGRGFYESMCTYMATAGPVVCMVWEGKNVVKLGRMMLGSTNPADSLPGTIRGDFALDLGRNICHGSDSVDCT